MLMLKALLRRHGRSLIAIWVTCALGITILVGLTGGCLSLEQACMHYLDEYSYFDVCISTEITGEDKLRTLARLPGVAHAEARMVANTTALGPGERCLSVRALTYSPQDWQRFIVWESVEAGDDPAVLVEMDFAQTVGIKAGDELRLRVDGCYRACVVEALVSAPETLAMVSIDTADVPTTDFGYVYVPVSLVAAEPNPTYDDAIEELSERQRELDASRRDAGKAYDQALGELDEAEGVLDQRLQEAAEALEELEELRETLDEQEEQAQDALSALQAGSDELDDAREQLTERRQELLDARYQADEARDELVARRDELEETRQQLVAQRQDLEEKASALIQAQEALSTIDDALGQARELQRLLSSDEAVMAIGLLARIDSDISLASLVELIEGLENLRTAYESYGQEIDLGGTVRQALRSLTSVMDTIEDDLRIFDDSASVELSRRIGEGDEGLRESDRGQALVRAVARYSSDPLSPHALEVATTRCRALQGLVDTYGLRDLVQRLDMVLDSSYEEWKGALVRLEEDARMLQGYLGDDYADIRTVGQLIDAYGRAREELESTLDALVTRRAQVVDELSTAGLAEQDLQDSLEQLDEVALTLAGSLAQLEEGLEQIEDGLSQAEEGIDAIDAGIAQIDDGLAQVDEGQSRLAERLGEARDALQLIASGRSDLDEAQLQLQDGMDALVELDSQLASRRLDADDQWQRGILEFSNLSAELQKAQEELGTWTGYQVFHNQFLLWLEDGSDQEAVLAAAERALAPTTVKSSYVYEASPVSIRLERNLTPLWELSYIMTGVFFAVVLLVSFLFMSVIVQQSRIDIGILRALGKSTGQVRAWFCSLGALVSAGALPLGMLMARSLAGFIANYYERLFHLPSCPVVFDYTVLVVAAVLTVVVVQLATSLGTSQLSGIEPSEAFSRALPTTVRVSRRWEHLTRHLDELSKFSILSLLRNPWRLAFSAACIAATMALILSARSFLASKNHILYQMFELALRYDCQVFLTQDPDEKVLREIEELPSVRDVQRMGFYGATLGFGGASEKVTLNALAQGSDLVGIYDTKGRQIELPREGIVLDEHLADRLGIQTGNVVDVDGHPLRVVALMRQDASPVQYLSLESAQVLGEPRVGCLIFRVEEGAMQRVLRLLSERDDYLLSIVTSSLHADTLRRFSPFDLSGFLLTCFAVTIGALVVFNVSQTNLLERKRELCVLRTLGFGHVAVSLVLLRQTLLAVALACLVGLPAGEYVAREILDRVSTSDLSFPFVNSAWEYGATILITLGYALGSHMLLMRVMRRWDINEGVREKE